MFSLVDRLQKTVGKTAQEVDLEKILSPYLRVHENGPNIDEALKPKGLLDGVVKKLLQRERRTARSKGMIHASRSKRFVCKKGCASSAEMLANAEGQTKRQERWYWLEPYAWVG